MTNLLSVNLPVDLVKQFDKARGKRSRRFIIEGLVRGFVYGYVDVPEAVPYVKVKGDD